MKTPSRKMPPAPTRNLPCQGWIFAGLLLAGLCYWIYRQHYVLLGALAVSLLVWIQSIYEKRRRRRLASSRKVETICTFARSFNRKTDTWILRAVYEELAKSLAVDGRPMPIRANDDWENDLKIDPDDLDDMADHIAWRTRRSLGDTKQNPLYGKVHTVRDIVGFFEHQPKMSNAGQAALNG